MCKAKMCARQRLGIFRSTHHFMTLMLKKKGGGMGALKIGGGLQMSSTAKKLTQVKDRIFSRASGDMEVSQNLV